MMMPWSSYCGLRSPSSHSFRRTVLVGALLTFSCQLACAEYTWNGSDWVWNDKGVSSNDMDGSGDKQSTLTGLSSQKSSEVDNGGSGDDDDDDRSSIESTSHTELGTLFNEPGTQELDRVDKTEADINFGETQEDNNILIGLNDDKKSITTTSFFAQPGTLAAIVGGAVVGLLCAILCVMFVVYRMRKKDEGSYALDEPKHATNISVYSKTPNREFYA